MDIYGFVLSSWFWFALTVIFILIELASAMNLTTIWFAVSSFALIFISGLTEMFDAPLRFRLHLGIFLGLSLVLFVFTRPFAVKKLKIGKEKTNADSLIGREALVIKKVSKFESGEIKLEGKIWTAIPETAEDINEGDTCVVLKFEGIKAVIKKV